MPTNIESKVKSATKWSTITEVVAKLVMPISNMVLARLLTPEAFGVVAIITMIISFAEIFTDAGFQKYLIQHEFENEEDKVKCTNVAFWSNLFMSLLIWLVVAVFCEPIAIVIGNPGLGYVIAIACISIPLAAFSSIQMALYKREFNFKTLFKVRLIGILIPLVVTIPLAIYFRNFWALLIGVIAKDFANAFLLTIYSKWKPSFYYSFKRLKEMFSFTFWSLLEAISLWLTGYIDIFIVGLTLSTYYLGIYRTSTTTVGQIMGLLTGITSPILFPALSRLQNDRESFNNFLLSFQKWTGLFILPLGVGIYCYRELVVSIMLGDQWTEASGFVGLWGLTSAFTIIFSHYCSEVYRSLGRPLLSVLTQWLHIIFLVPIVYICVRYDFETLYIARSFVRLELIAVNLVITYFFIKMSFFKMIGNLIPELIGCIIIFCCSCLFSFYDNGIMCNVISIIISIFGYFCVVCLFKTERNTIVKYIKK